MITKFQIKKNYSVIIIGGSNGIGRNISESFLRAGSKIIIFDKSEPQPSFEKKYYNKISFEKVNLNNLEATLTKFKKHCNDKFCPDALINLPRTKENKDIENLTIDEWDYANNVMLRTPFFLSKEFLKHAKSEKPRSIINICSLASKLVTGESPSYHIAKAGLAHLTRYLSIAGAGKFVRSNAILPGFILQERYKKKYFSKDNLDYVNKVRLSLPLKKEGTEEDISSLILFLSSDNASFINGQCIVLDGGSSNLDLFFMINSLN